MGKRTHAKGPQAQLPPMSRQDDQGGALRASSSDLCHLVGDRPPREKIGPDVTGKSVPQPCLVNP